MEGGSKVEVREGGVEGGGKAFFASLHLSLSVETESTH